MWIDYMYSRFHSPTMWSHDISGTCMVASIHQESGHMIPTNATYTVAQGDSINKSNIVI